MDFCKKRYHIFGFVMLRALFILSLLLFFATPTLAETTKREAVAVALKALNEVYVLSGKYGPDIKYDADAPNGAKTFERFDKHFDAYLDKISDPFALKEISILCNAVTIPFEAGDGNVDEYFDRCLYAAMWRLAKIKGNEAREHLIDIARYIQLDGHLGEEFGDAITKQNKLNGLPPPKLPFDPWEDFKKSQNKVVK